MGATAVGYGPDEEFAASEPATETPMPQRKGFRPKRRAVTSPARTGGPQLHRDARRAAGPRGLSKAGPISDRFFRQLVFSLRNGVLVITRDGRLAAVNAEACRIFRLKRGQRLVGRPFAEVLQSHPDVVRMLTSTFDLHNLPNRAELRLRASGKVIGYTLSHVSDERGRHTGAALFFKDLTRVEQLEERERLRDRLAALGEMAAAIAHEVKNPLAGIEVMAGLLRRQIPDSPDAQSILQDIIHEVKMANAIVLEALEFVRPIRLQVEHTSVAEVLQNAITLAKRQMPERAVDVQIELIAGLPLIHGDQHQLCQLFTNLLINAFEALDGRGRVSIAAREEVQEDDHGHGDHGRLQRSVVIDVDDDGPGVPRDLRDRIFNAFFTTKPQGSGLGLAIVRKIVDAHDGRIDLTSAPGRGTRFRVTLPVVASGGDEWFGHTRGR
jgi:PAS domain S-box-containing protein